MKTCVEKRMTLGAPGPEVMEQVIAGNTRYLEANEKRTHPAESLFEHALGSSVESNERILSYRFWKIRYIYCFNMIKFKKVLAFSQNMV